MIELTVNDNYYKQHPEKVLGEAYQTTGRFSDNVTKYRGDLSSLEKIQVINYLVADMLSPHLSSEHQDTTPATIHAGKAQNIKKALQQSSKERSSREQAQNEDVDLITFDEIDQLYNAHLSREQKEVYSWYQRTVLGRPMEGGWEKYHNASAPSAKVVPMDWVKNGLVYWFRDGFLPAFIYLSGNMAERRSQLGQDEDKIRRMPGGEAILKAQEKALEETWQKVIKIRQRLDAENFEDRLIIKPVSSFAKEYKIKALKGDVKLQAQKRRNGQIDFLEAQRSGWKRDLEVAVNLQEAFVLWMSENVRTLDIRRGLTWKDIAELYLMNKKRGKDDNPVDFRRKKSAAQQEGIRLFSDFLARAILDEDREQLESLWNERYNSDVPVDFNQVPIGFSMARFYNGMEMDIRPEKREAIAFAQIRGAGCLAYGVGLGKTWCAIFIIAQFLENGWCKRPCLVLPNQVYKQFMSECKGILPHLSQNDLFNLSTKYLENIPEEGLLPESSVSFFTYEGFKRIGLDTGDEGAFFSELMNILDQDKGASASKKEYERQKNKIEGIIGKSQQGSRADINNLGLDMIAIDEAHSAKKVFTTVKGAEEENLGKSKTIKRYDITSGQPSGMGLKTFMVSQYIQKKNRTGNVLLLTATPFTNSPMEIFSMTSLMGLEYLRSIGLLNLNDFFDQFVSTTNELVFGIGLKPEFKDVFTGFNNLSGLQGIIRRFFLYKQSTKNLKRPNKVVLPFRQKLVDGIKLELGENETIETVLPFTPFQRDRMEDILSYAQDGVDITQICENAAPDDEEAGGGGARLLRAAGMARKLAFSPYMLKCDAETQAPKSVQDFIESSSKLQFIMACIQSVKDWHEAAGSPMSGQIIYSNMGVDYFPMLRRHLMEKLGFQPHEVGIIVSESRMKKMGFKDKRTVQNAFLGRRYNPQTRDYEDIPHEYRCKVLIGSSTIREGINLQRFASALYILELPWNPTDVNQLEGRLWRQGNIFRNVRIVNPLMEDSMDIFMFQKLEEKTARINAIWDFDGNTSTLDTREFDPAELKYVLIKDPYRVAELEAKEREVEIDDELVTINSQITTLEDFSSTRYTVFNKLPDIIKALSFYRDLTVEEMDDPATLKRYVDYMLRAKKLKDGREIEALLEENRRMSRYHGGPYSDAWIGYSAINPPYWYSDWKKSLATYNNTVNDVLKKRGLDDSEEAVESAVNQLKEQKEKLDEQLKALMDKTRLAERAAEIQAEKDRKGIAPASVPQRAKEFARLNALLSDLRVDEPQESIQGEAPDAPYRKGETVGYDEGKARVEKAMKMNNGKIVYLVRQKTFTELVLEDELSPTNAAQRKRLSSPTVESKKEKEVPVAKPNTAVMAKIRLAKAKKAKKLKLLQLAEAA
ncbi:MAG: DEAD/DEAH box helicase family protein [Lewinellaceae bacterium]|nr:DEAD/DEAH box helicase family protein [Lewinellaceae bacterium]